MTLHPQPIIDAHHHYWDPRANYHPWLRDEPMLPFRYGDYSSIRAPFLPAQYDVHAQNFQVITTVTMEGEWDEADQVAESAWMTKVSETHQRPSAHVARTFLHKAGAADEIARHAAFPVVRAIRHKPTVAAKPGTIEHGVSGSMSDPAWRDGYAALKPNGLHFELQAPWWHAQELLDLIDRFADTPVVINHCFMPVDRSSDGLAQWRDAIALVASAPNVSMKISGIGIKGRRWSLDDQRPVIDTCIDIFGPKRCLFASNFPVDGLVGSFDEIYGGFITATADLSAAERNMLFHDNAVRIYRLENIARING